MATTIDAAFRKLKSNLEITDLQGEAVSERQQNVREVVEGDFTVYETFLTGSYMRDTMIGPLKSADVDIFVVLHPSYCKESGQRDLLSSMRKTLRKTYTLTPEISPNGQAVTITFTDFKVDVVPGFYHRDGGFLIPDASLGRWLRTDPKKHIEIWTNANKAHNNDLIPLIKMVKAWNKPRDLLRSFHLEVLVLNVLNGVNISSFPSGVRFVLDKIRPKIRVKIPDPAGYNDDVAVYISTVAEMDRIVQRIDWAYERAVEAEKLAAAGNVRGSLQKWSLLFKDYFPAYG